MEKAYWLSRKAASLKLARGASSSEVRLIHYDMAGRYSLNADAAEGSASDHATAPAKTGGRKCD